jgi:ABC exporter DevB family membrane fusion protein
MSKKIIYVATVLVVAVVVTIAVWQSRSAAEGNRGREAQPVGVRTDEPQPLAVSAPGRVEPISEEIEVGVEVAGKIRSVAVEEGDRVRRGQTLAVLENDDYRAQLASAAARIREAEAELRRVVNGARTEERGEARAAVEQAEAVARNARLEVSRRQTLARDGDIPREEYDRAVRDLRVAEARVKELRERAAFVGAAAREEDVARGEAGVALARAQASEARARLEKTVIRSPISGVVLRKRRRAGESVSPESANASLFTVADTSVLRVRADLDEVDVARIRQGQRAYLKADAYGERQFWGRVVRVGQVLGRKNIRTEEPVERVDTKVLETLIELDPGQILPPGLRVDAYIIVGNGREN